jgi:general secretion pathway protein D
MRRLAGIALALAVLWAASPARSQEEELQLNFRDTEAGAIIDAIARATGTRIISDPALRQRLTIALEDKVSRREAFEILTAALLTIGFAPVPIPGGGYVVLPIEAARQSAPWIHRSVGEDSEQMVTTLVRLTGARADELVKLLVPGDRSAVAVAYPPTNSIILSAAEDRIASLLDLLRALDQATTSRLEVLPLRWADAGAVATQLDTLFPPGDSTSTPVLPLKVTVDPRTNSLIVAGAPKRIHEVRKYVELVDVPKRAKGKVHVVRVLNAEATALAQQLNAIALEEAPVRGAGRGGAAMAKLPGRSYSIVADEGTNSLLIQADAVTFGLLADVIGELDRIPPRIAVEVSLWAVETTQALDLGFDALLPLVIPDDAGDVVAFAAFGNPAPLIEQAVRDAGPFIARFTREPLLLPVIGPDGNPTTIVAPGGGGQFTAAAGDVTLRVLSNPYLLAASGEEQHIFAGESVPVPVSGGGTTPPGTGSTQSGGTTTPGFVPSGFVTEQTITRQDVGIDLRVKPVSLSDHLVLLEIAIDVSSVAPTASANDELGPTVNQIKMEATVRVADGAVMLLASAPRDKTENFEESVPYLGKIPILGWLFKATSDRIVRRRLVAAVQVTQLHSPSEERAEQMERVLAFQRRSQRTQSLRALVTEPYALLVATRDTREAATDVLPHLSDLDGDKLVIEWRDDPASAPRYDVYLAGFRDISALGDEAAKLRERGFTPRLEIAGDPVP